jgi:hypothetical protein
MSGSLNEFYNQGDRRLKRVGLIIRSKKHPGVELPGYALMTELNEEMLSFFSAQKFLVDEGLTINMQVGPDELEFQLRLSHLHEQISSGRIMTQIPTEEHPFPARKFYRCFAKVLEVKRNGIVLNNAASEASAPVAMPNEPIPLQAVTEEIQIATDPATEFESALKAA